MIEKSDEEIMYATTEEWDEFNLYIKGLPTMGGFNNTGLDKYGVPIPYGSGPHLLKHFKTVVDIVNPKRILEIGLNYGTSSSFWLNLSNAFVTAVDISDKHETVTAGNILKERFAGRFEYLISDSKLSLSLLKDNPHYDLIFIDGGHDEPDVTADIQLAKDLEIPHLFFDDIYFRFGPGVIVSIDKFPELELIKDMDNLRLYKFVK